jgi:hypothetical protein
MVSEHRDSSNSPVQCTITVPPKVNRDSVTYTEHAKQKTVTAWALDVVYALNWSGCTLCWSSRTLWFQRIETLPTHQFNVLFLLYHCNLLLYSVDCTLNCIYIWQPHITKIIPALFNFEWRVMEPRAIFFAKKMSLGSINNSTNKLKAKFY